MSVVLFANEEEFANSPAPRAHGKADVGEEDCNLLARILDLVSRRIEPENTAFCRSGLNVEYGFNLVQFPSRDFCSFTSLPCIVWHIPVAPSSLHTTFLSINLRTCETRASAALPQ